MIRLSKLTDYAIVLLSYSAKAAPGTIYTAKLLAEESGLPLPTVSKILKSLSRSGLLVSHRGNKGGYSLVRAPQQISIVDIITAMEGSPSLTECSSSAPVLCSLEETCPTRANWLKISGAVFEALSNLTLCDMVGPFSAEQKTSASESIQPFLKIVRR